MAGWRGSQPLTFLSSGLWHPQSRFDAPFPQMHRGNESPACRVGTKREDRSPGFGASWGRTELPADMTFVLLALGCQIPWMTDLLARFSVS